MFSRGPSGAVISTCIRRAMSYPFVLSFSISTVVMLAVTMNAQIRILNNISQAGAYINVAGRQRMFSQRIPLLSLHAHRDEPCPTSVDQLQRAKVTFLRAHEDIAQVSMTPQTRDDYMDTIDTLADFMKAIASPDTPCSALNASTLLLEHIDDLVGSMEQDLQDSVRVSSLALIVLESVLAFLTLTLAGCSVSKTRRDTRRYMTSMERLIEYIFHEIRNPLNHVVNGVEHILSMACLTTEIKETLMRCSSGGAMITMLLDDVLTMASIDSQSAFTVDPARVSSVVRNVASVVTLSSKESEHNVKVETDICMCADMYFMNRIRLTQVLMNLATNAVKYAGSGKTVTLGARSGTTDTSGDVVHFFVRDDGAGITKAVRDQLFSKFRTLRRDSGTGLGLFFVNSIVESMGGKVRVTSPVPGTTCGSVFEFSVVLRRCTEAECRDEESQELCDVPSNLHVVVADDERINCKIVERKLSSPSTHHLNWAVRSTTTLAGALELCRGTSVDVILLDENFGNGESGSEYIKVLRQEGVECAILMVSANCSPADDALYRSRGAFGTVPKPVPSPETLIRAIHVAIQTRPVNIN